MQLLIADYAIGAIAVALAVLGLIRGLSGSLAFAAASAMAVCAGSFGWEYTAAFTAVTWQRVCAELVATLLVFALVRIVVRRLVNGLLDQPADAIFGFLAGLGIAALLVFAWARSGLFVEYSRLVQEVASYVR